MDKEDLYMISLSLTSFSIATGNLENLEINSKVSLALVEIVKRIKVQPRYLLAKVGVVIIHYLQTNVHSMYRYTGTIYSYALEDFIISKWMGGEKKKVTPISFKRSRWPMRRNQRLHLKILSHH